MTSNRERPVVDGLVVSNADLDAAATRAQQWRDRFDTGRGEPVPLVGGDEAAQWFHDSSAFGALLRLAADINQDARSLLNALLKQDRIELPQELIGPVVAWGVAGVGLSYLCRHVAADQRLGGADRRRLVRHFCGHGDPLQWHTGASVAGRSDLTDDEAEQLAASPWTEVVDAVASNPHVADHIRVFAGMRRRSTRTADDIDFVS